MLDFLKEKKRCHVCLYEYPLAKDGSAPPECPACGADLANPDAEYVNGTVECGYAAGAIGTDKGVMYVTNQRVFWIKGAVSAESLGGGITKDEVQKGGLFKADTVTQKVNPLSTIAVAGIAAKMQSKGAGKASVNISLDDIARLEDYKKMLGRGVTVHTKSGASYSFTLPNLCNPQIFKDLLSPYANG